MSRCATAPLAVLTPPRDQRALDFEVRWAVAGHSRDDGVQMVVRYKPWCCARGAPSRRDKRFIPRCVDQEPKEGQGPRPN